MKLNQISLGIASLTGNRDSDVVTAINQSLPEVLKPSHFLPSPLGKCALPSAKLREGRLGLNLGAPRSKKSRANLEGTGKPNTG